MKRFIFAAAAIAAMTAYCMDLTLTDGKTYTDVKIMSKTPDGFDIESHRDNDVTILRHIRFTELSPESQKLFPDYDAAKVKSYIDSLQVAHSKAQQKNAAKQAEWEKKSEAGEQVIYPDNDNVLKIVFKATRNLEHGTIGWASSDDETVTTGHYGKIYIYGLKITEGNEWVGKVYPTDQSVSEGNSIVPCFAISDSAAKSIDARAKKND